MPYDPTTNTWISEEDLYDLEYEQVWVANPEGTGGHWTTQPTGADTSMYQTDYNPNLSASELANMSSTNLETLIQMYDLDPDKYQKYFAKFNPQEIEDIQKNLELKKNQLSTESTRTLQDIQAKGGAAKEQYRTATSQRGFETSGDIEEALKKQQKQFFSTGKSQMTGIGVAGQQARLGAEQETRSAYEDYESQFFSALSGVEAQIAAEDNSGGGGGGGCCFIVLEVEEKNKLNKDVRKYRDEQLNDLNRAGYYKLAQVAVPLMRKSKLVKWFFKYSFVKPAKSWAKWYYHKKGMGWAFEPLRRFWLGMFTYLGKDHKLRVDNG